MFSGEDGFEVVGEAATGAEAVVRAEALRPDVVLMDLRMPEMDGVTAIARLTRSGSPARVLVLTTYDTDSDVLPAIEAGATGYLLKDARAEELFRAVRAAARGEAVLSPSVADPAARPGAPAGPRAAERPRAGGARAGRPRRDQPGGGAAALRLARRR